MQPPGYIHIVHKNRAQMLTRDRVFENTLKSWSEKQKEIERSVSPQPTSLSEEESLVLQNFVEVASTLIKGVKIASLKYSAVEQELFPLATQASEYMDRLFPAGKLAEPTLRSQVIDFVRSVQHLNHDTSNFLSEKAAVLERLNASLAHLELELQKICQVCGINSTFQYDPSQITQSQEELIPLEHKRKPGKLRQVYSKLKGKNKDKQYIPLSYNVYNWTPEDVGQWLESRSLSEYKDSFIRNEIRGTELLTLDKGDLQDLGVTKVGHLKRIQQEIKELNNRMTAYDKSLVFDKNSS
uniref:SAM domain-containing protein n=1 Tax=Magallana gigas TaxID=29159 RepID=A0A8W8IX28_MAGGI